MSEGLQRPKAGQVWVKDGRYRVVVDPDFQGGHRITWRRPGSRSIRESWAIDFYNWMDDAKLVESTPPPTRSSER